MISGAKGALLYVCPKYQKFMQYSKTRKCTLANNKIRKKIMNPTGKCSSIIAPTASRTEIAMQTLLASFFLNVIINEVQLLDAFMI